MGGGGEGVVDKWWSEKSGFEGGGHSFLSNI